MSRRGVAVSPARAATWVAAFKVQHNVHRAFSARCATLGYEKREVCRTLIELFLSQHLDELVAAQMQYKPLPIKAVQTLKS